MEPDSKNVGVYTGRIINNNPRVFKNGIPFKKHCFHIRKHSPNGFAWGYLGSGPAQLALALIYDRCRNKEIAEKIYQYFKEEVIAGFPTEEPWEMSFKEVDWYIDRHITSK